MIYVELSPAQRQAIGEIQTRYVDEVVSERTLAMIRRDLLAAGITADVVDVGWGARGWGRELEIQLRGPLQYVWVTNAIT